MSREKIDIKLSVKAKNNAIAAEIRKQFTEKGIKSINIMGSVGSGKTTLITQLAKKLSNKYKILIINGDWTTDWKGDLERFQEAGSEVQALQINTYGSSGCHLTAMDINDQLMKNDILSKGYTLIIIENVGNLICPSSWDLGVEKRIVMVSVTEGPYMIKKHQYMFATADLAIINKVELAKVMEVNVNDLVEDAHKIKSNLAVIPISAKTGDGVEQIIETLKL